MNLEGFFHIMGSMSDTAAARKFVVCNSVGFAICLTKKTILVLATTECLVVFGVIYWIQQDCYSFRLN